MLKNLKMNGGKLLQRINELMNGAPAHWLFVNLIVLSFFFTWKKCFEKVNRTTV